MIDILKPIPESHAISPSPDQSSTGKTFFLSESQSLLARGGTLNAVIEEQEQSTWSKILNPLLSTLVVITSVAQTISLPLYAGSMNKDDTGSDPFIAFFLASMWFPIIFWCILLIQLIVTCSKPAQLCLLKVAWLEIFLAGLLAGLSQILIALSSAPDRTPPYLQSVFQQSLMVPFTAFARYIVLSKCK